MINPNAQCIGMAFRVPSRTFALNIHHYLPPLELLVMSHQSVGCFAYTNSVSHT